MLYTDLTDCCALGILRADNDSTLEEIEQELRDLRALTDGLRTVICIVKKTEPTLRSNLLKLKFKRLLNFPRRRPLRRYPTDTLTMYVKILK